VEGDEMVYLVRVPIRVKDDDRVSRLEVQAQPTSSGTEQEYKVWGILNVEHLQHVRPVVGLGSTIKSKVGIA
jgi:hypothetical protein